MKLMLRVQGPEQVSLWPTPGRLTPKSWGTAASSFWNTTVTLAFAGTVIDDRS